MSDQTNYNNPTYSGTTVGAWSSYALTFNGTNQYCTISPFDISGAWSFAVAFTGGASSGVAYVFSLSAASGQNFYAYLNAGALNIGHNISESITAITIPDDGYHEVGYATDGTNWEVTLDGVSYATGTLVSPTNYTGQNFFLAVAPLNNSPYSAYYAGTVDDCILSSAQCAESDFAALYSAGTTLPSTVRSVRFEEGPGGSPTIFSRRQFGSRTGGRLALAA